MIFIKHEGAELCPITLIDYSESEVHKTYFGDILPSFIYCEIIEICRDFGFIEGGKICFDKEIHIDEQQLNSMILPAQTNQPQLSIEQSSTLLISFFQKIRDLNLEISKLRPDSAPYGLFRFSSIYDINIQYLDYNLEDFLDFLYINLLEQRKIFGDSFIDELIQNSGLPFDNVDNRSGIYFSARGKSSDDAQIMYKGTRYPLITRIVPGFGPGVEFIVSIDPLSEKINRYNNIGINVAIRFERNKGDICPIIHVLQCPYWNLWLQEDKIIFEEKTGSDNEIFKKQIFTHDMLSDFCMQVVKFLFERNYSEIYFIAAEEMLWAILHNQNKPHIHQNIVRKYIKTYNYLTGSEISLHERGIITKDLLKENTERENSIGHKFKCHLELICSSYK